VSQSTPLIDQRIVKALGHPLRVQILAILDERVASPNEISKETGESLGTVSYHVRLLAKLDCLELVETVPRRGALEHYYRATVRPWFEKEDWQNLPASLRGGVSSEVLSLIVKDAASSIESGAFESREDIHLSRTPLLLDEEAWEELAARLDELLERALELKAESAGRALEQDERVPCELALMHYPKAAARPARRPKSG
jgi:DNA-binding transcriptional ArsR family regulator